MDGSFIEFDRTVKKFAFINLGVLQSFVVYDADIFL